jgi:hypothetical protein
MRCHNRTRTAQHMIDVGFKVAASRALLNLPDKA